MKDASVLTCRWVPRSVSEAHLLVHFRWIRGFAGRYRIEDRPLFSIGSIGVERR